MFYNYKNHCLNIITTFESLKNKDDYLKIAQFW